MLDPTSVDWILNNPSPDPAQHYLGWELFRRSPVHLPYIGANYNAVYPFRTSVLFTDSLPLAALFFKLLGGVLPARFQYFGWWGLACYMLQGGLAQAVIARIAGVQPTVDRSGSKAAIGVIMSPQQTAKLWGSVAGAGLLVLFPALTMLHVCPHGTRRQLAGVAGSSTFGCAVTSLCPRPPRLPCLGGHGICSVRASICTTCRWSVLCLWDTRCAAPCKNAAGGCAGTIASVLRCGAGRSWCCWGRSLSTLRATPTATSAARITSAWVWCHGWHKAGSKMSMQASGTSLAVVLAVFGIVCNARKAEKFFAAHRDWLIAALWCWCWI